MGRYEDLKEMLHAELAKIQDKGELTAATLSHADMIAHTLKDLCAIDKEDKGYAEDYPRDYAERRRGMYGYDGRETSYRGRY